MYNRYIPSQTGWERVRVSEDPAPPPPPSGGQGLGGLTGLLEELLPDKAGWEDLLLLLILLLLALEGEEGEVLITLGLLIVLGLD